MQNSALSVIKVEVEVVIKNHLIAWKTNNAWNVKLYCPEQLESANL